MSSYAAVHIIREEYGEALRLLTQATAISPQDPIILNNLYVLNVWLGKYEAASNLNKQLLKAEPKISQHVTRRALLDVLYLNKRNDDSWQRFLKIQTEKNKAYWEYFLGTLVKADKSRNFEELTDMGNQWIDIGMSSEALLLFDHILSLANVPTAHFLKAKAFEQGKHYKLAFQSAQNALQMAASIDGVNKDLYRNILYETARLAYAANEYENSLALLNKYKNSGYSHPHLDYMFAVNLDASGKYSEATPYLQKCVTQQLPDYMLSFCKKNLANHTIASKPETASPVNKAIRISNKSDSPSSVMRLSWPSPTVGWLGEVIDVDVTETNTTLHIRLTAQFLQPTTPLEIEDGKHYEIPIEPKNPAELFVVNLNFGSLTKEKIQGLKDSITKEKYLIAQGHAAYLGIFNKQLAPGVQLERAIFTSKITPNELR
jgi:Flp pilus assembly protein TadD